MGIEHISHWGNLHKPLFNIKTNINLKLILIEFAGSINCEFKNHSNENSRYNFLQRINTPLGAKILQAYSSSNVTSPVRPFGYFWFPKRALLGMNLFI